MQPKPTTDLPILFSAPMVLAALTDEKIITRRAVNPQPRTTAAQQADGFELTWRVEPRTDRGMYARFVHQLRGVEDDYAVWARCPYGGETLWGREAWRAGVEFDRVKPKDIPPGSAVRFEADGQVCSTTAVEQQWGKLRPGMFQPKWASRLHLRVGEIRVERLHALTCTEAFHEGIGSVMTPDWLAANYPQQGRPDAVRAFATLWNAINGDGAWQMNPVVWCVPFTRIKPC